MISNTVALEDNAALELPRSVALRHFGVLFDGDAEEVSEVDEFVVVSGFASNIRPLSHVTTSFVPT